MLEPCYCHNFLCLFFLTLYFVSLKGQLPSLDTAYKDIHCINKIEIIMTIIQGHHYRDHRAV